MHPWTNFRVPNCSSIHCYHQNVIDIVLKSNLVQQNILPTENNLSHCEAAFDDLLCVSGCCSLETAQNLFVEHNFFQCLEYSLG